MKRKTIKKLNALAFIVWILSGSSVDSESWIPLIVCAIATIWLGLFLDDGKKRKGGECHAVD